MGSIADLIFVDNLHIMFGEHYLLNTVNTIFTDMSPEYVTVMKQKLYQEVDNSSDVDKREKYQKDLMLDYLSNLLAEFFGKIRNNITRGGGINKMDQVKNYIREKVSNIKPKFYT